jgi:hypothetical protein
VRGGAVLVASAAFASALVAAFASALVAAFACALVGPPREPFAERPYVWASEGRVELLTCRWSGAEPIGVGLAADADAAEESALDTALGALAGAAPGLRFLRVREGAAPLVVRFVPDPVARADGSLGTGRSVADCRLSAAGVRAALVAAQVEIARRTPPDWRAEPRPLAPEERIGALLHELAHALGVAGHAAAGDELLSASPEAVRRVGARALAGERIASPALAALYARPSGDRLAEARVEPWRTRDLDRLARLAATHRLDGPYLRAGDAAGRIFWRDARGREWGFLVADLAGLARDPTRLLLLPEANTRDALPRARSRATP